MEENKKQQKSKKLSYEELENAAKQISAQLDSMARENAQLSLGWGSHQNSKTSWMMIFGSSSPGIPVEVEVITPGRLPVRAKPSDGTPECLSRVLASVCVMEPTTDAFFC